MGLQTSNSYLSEEDALFRDGFALFETGSAQNDVKLLRASCEKLSEVVRRVPTGENAWRILAKALFHSHVLTENQGQILRAKEAIDKTVEFLPSPAVHAEAGLIYEKLATISQEACDYAAAISHFEKANLGVPEWTAFGRAYTALAHKLSDKRLLIKAANCFRKGLPDANVPLSRVLRELFYMSKEPSLAVEAWNCLYDAHLLAPENQELHIEKIELLLELGDLAHAIKLCEEFPHQDDPLLLSLFARAFALLGERENRPDFLHRALEKLEKIEEETPHILTHIGKTLVTCAHNFCDLDFYHQALEAFQAATSLDRTHAEAWKWMGKCAVLASHWKADDDIPALKFYQKALALKPDHELYFAIAILLIQQEAHVEQATSYLDYLQESYPLIYHKNPDWLFYYATSHNVLGFLRGDEVAYKKSLTSFRALHALAPSYPNLHHQWALLYFRMAQDFDTIPDFYKALRHFELGSKKTENEETLYIDWGLTWLHLTDYSTSAKTTDDCLALAEQKFKMAAQLGNRDVYYHLACLYSLKSQPDLTLHYLTRCLQADTLPPLTEIEDDEWLENFRFSSLFQQFLDLFHSL